MVLKARSRCVAGDLSLLRKKRCRRACIIVDYGSLTLEKITQYLILTKSLIIQVPHQPNHVPLLSTNLGFSFPVFSPGWKVFSLTISILYNLSVFLIGLTIIGLEGFSPVTWPSKTHQLPYGARMFSLAFRFSSHVSLIGFGDFSPGSHSSLQSFHAQQSSRPKMEVILIMWPSEPEQKVAEAEVTWQQSSMTSLWSA